MDAATYITENASYLDEASNATLAKLTQQQFEALVEISEDVGHGPDIGINNTLVASSESLEDFENSRKTSWRECGKASSNEFGGFPTMVYEGVQLFKNQPRINLIAVIQFDGFTVTLR